MQDNQLSMDIASVIIFSGCGPDMLFALTFRFCDIGNNADVQSIQVIHEWILNSRFVHHTHDHGAKTLSG